MNKNKNIIYLLFTTTIFFLTLLFLNTNLSFASCTGDATCSYTYNVKRCSNDNSLCATSAQCPAPGIGEDPPTCDPAEETTDKQPASCAAQGLNCELGGDPCISPYTLTSGACSSYVPTPTPTIEDPDPTPPPNNCTPGWCGDCTCPESELTGRAVLIFFEDTNQNGVWDFYDGVNQEPRIHPYSDNNVYNTIVVPGVKLYMNGRNMVQIAEAEIGLMSDILNKEYTEAYRCNPDTTVQCRDWGVGAEGWWNEKCLTGPANCKTTDSNSSNECKNTTPMQAGSLCDTNWHHCVTSSQVITEPGDLRHGYIYYIKDYIGTKNMTIITPDGWDISSGTHSLLNTGGTNQFSFQLTTSGNKSACTAGLKAIGLVPSYNKQCTVDLTKTSIQKNDVVQESTKATVWGYSAKSGTEETRLFVANADYTEILNELGQPFTPSGTTHIEYSGRNYYEYTQPTGGCNTGDSTPCIAETIISDLPVGNYKLHCDLPNSDPTPASSQRCSGNPNCTYEGGSVICSDWTSCSNQDNIDLEVVCSQTCTEDCGTGQTTDQIPGIPTSVTVNGISGNNLNLSNNPLARTISWTASSITDPGTILEYDVWLVPRGSTSTICTGTCRNLGTTTGTSISLPSVSATQTNNFDIRVRAKNGCSTPGNWTTRQVDLTANISGTIYDAVVTPGGSNNCTIPNPIPSTLDISAGFVSLTNNGGGSLLAAPGNAYVLENAPYEPDSLWLDENTGLTLNLNSAPADPADSFYCSCPGEVGGSPFACGFTNNLFSPSTDKHFFVTAIDLSNGPWWQGSEGNVYGAASYNNPIPDACDLSPTCNANAVLQNTDNDSKSAGIPMSGGSITGTSYYTEYDGLTQPRSENTQHNNIIKEDYNYFVRNINLSSAHPIPTAINSIAELGTGTTYDDAEIHYLASNNLVLTLDNQTINSGTKIIIFVDGDVTIQNGGSLGDQVLDVEDGGYFAVIASGSITIANDIGHTCSYPTCSATTTNLDGVYVASTNLILADNGDDDTPDNMFVGEGTFVGWEGINLNRSFDNNGATLDRALNNEYPTQLFKFRPDFNENTPELLKHPNLVWQEVN